MLLDFVVLTVCSRRHASLVLVLVLVLVRSIGTRVGQVENASASASADKGVRFVPVAIAIAIAIAIAVVAAGDKSIEATVLVRVWTGRGFEHAERYKYFYVPCCQK